MLIKLEGNNKQLLQEYIFERYEAQKAEKNNKWHSFKKHSDAADYKLKFILNALNISSKENLVYIDTEDHTLMVTPIKKEVEEKLKHGRRLTKKEKLFLKSQGLEPKNFLRTKRTSEVYEFVNIDTGRTIKIRY